MGTRYDRLFYTLLMNFFVLFLSTEGRSAPTEKPTMITDVMKNDTYLLCNTTKFLYDSNYVKPCASLPYPNSPRNLNSSNVNTFLCLGMYDMAYKLCHSSQLQINSTEAFDLGVKKFIPSKNQTEQFCHSLHGFTLTYNKTKLLGKPLIGVLNSTLKCGMICFNLNDETINPLCAMLALSKHITNTIHVDTNELKSDRSTTNKVLSSQANSETSSKSTQNAGPKMDPLETKETKEQITKQTSNNDNAEEKSNNAGNTQSTGVKPDAQNLNPYTEASSGKDKILEKKKNNTLPETQAKGPLLVTDKDINEKLKPNAERAKLVNNLQTSSVNAANEDAKKYVDEDKKDEPNKDKDQDADDVRPTTLSENTQEHDDNLEDTDPAVDGIDEIEDANQQSIDTEGNQNENAQEPYEQKHSTQRFPRLRSDDSHFFFYFTVVTLACIAGYIGYHNKQKILAIVLEGRRSRNSRGRRRPSTANYRKLDCTLEEAVTSQCNSNVTHVIY